MISVFNSPGLIREVFREMEVAENHSQKETNEI
jgi:hypothetical protein